MLLNITIMVYKFRVILDAEEDVLRDGYIPWKNIINKPNLYTPSKHNHDNYIVKSANVIAFTAGTEVPNNNDGKPDGTVYFKYSN